MMIFEASESISSSNPAHNGVGQCRYQQFLGRYLVMLPVEKKKGNDMSSVRIDNCYSIQYISTLSSIKFVNKPSESVAGLLYFPVLLNQFRHH
jgi:hypothetical protein